MGQYLLATYAREGEASSGPGTPEEMAAFMKRVAAVETEMDESGATRIDGQPSGSTIIALLSNCLHAWYAGGFFDLRSRTRGPAAAA